MPFLIAIGAWLAAALGITMTALVVGLSIITATILTIIGYITDNQLLIILGAIVGVAGMVYSFVHAWTVALQISEFAAMTPWQIMKLGINTWLTNIQIGIKAILGAIHFELIIQLHSIAYILSRDYREFIDNLYRQLAQVSHSLGWGGSTMVLMFYSIRNLVMDVSSTLGRSFDLTEVGWLKDLSAALEMFNANMTHYSHHPGDFLVDLDKLISKPYIDTKAKFMRSILITIDALNKGIITAVAQAQRIRGDLEEIIQAMPERWKDDVEKALRPITGEFDKFIANIYIPAMGVMSKLLRSLGIQNESQAGNIKDILARMRDPGAYLMEVDTLSPWRKRRAEYYMGDLSQRGWSRDHPVVESDIEDFQDHLDAIEEALKRIPQPPPYHIEEWPTPITPPGVKPRPKETWFVGDY